MAQFKAPNGSPIVATLEVIEGTCGIEDIDPVTGEVEYDGTGTKIDWDSQKTKTNFRGERLFVAEDYQVWPFSDLVEVKESTNA